MMHGRWLHGDSTLFNGVSVHACMYDEKWLPEKRMCLQTILQQVAGILAHSAASFKQVVSVQVIIWECPALKLLMSNGIVFDVAAAALPRLSLLLVIDPMRLQEVSFSLFCMQTETVQKIQKRWGHAAALFTYLARRKYISLYSFRNTTQYSVSLNNQCNAMASWQLEYSQFLIAAKDLPSLLAIQATL